MSQYQPPYTPPTGYDYAAAYGPYADLLAPARRAGLLMIILGSLKLLCGVFSSLISARWDKLPAEMVEQLRPMEAAAAQAGLSLPQVLLAQGIVLGVVGLGLLILGIFVRRGRKGVVITSFILCAVILAAIAYQVAFQVGASLSHGISGRVFADLCVPAAIAALYVLMFVWLLQAMRAGKKLRLAQQQYAAMYWQYMQQQQAYMRQAEAQQTPQPPQSPTTPGPNA